MSFWLEFSKDGQTQQFSFDRDRIIIGRDRAADFVIDHPTVSRQHGTITLDQRGFHLTVLSRGGMTAIGGQQVQGEVPLYDGTEIYFGSQHFTFRSNSAPPAPQQSGGWNTQPQQPPQQQNWNTQPQGGGWEQPSGPQQAPQQQNWNNNPGSGQNGGWQQSGPQHAPQQPGHDPHAGPAWDSEWDQPAQPAPAQPDHGAEIETWGEIAARAESEATRAKARDIPKPDGGRAKQKTSPMLLVALVAMVGLLGYAFVKPMLAPPPPPPPPPMAVPTGQIDMTVECVGTASCEQEAFNAFKVGKAAQERSNADIANLYEAHYQFTRAQKLLDQGAVKEPPAEMDEMRSLHEPVKKQLQTYFQQERVKFRDARKKKDADRMKAAIVTVKAYVPDDACDYNKWAEAREDEMQDKGIWPADVDKYGRPLGN